MTDDHHAHEMKRVFAVALAIAFCGYFCLSAICLWWPSLLDAFAVSLPPYLGPVVGVLLGPPGLLLWGSDAVSVYWWVTAIFGISTALTFAGWWSDGGSVLVCFWGGLSVIVWMGCFLLHLMAAA